MAKVAIVIPSYEPDDNLVTLCENLIKEDLQDIIVIDDGSGDEYQEIFDKVASMKCVVLKHAINQGKGRALKFAFNYLLTRDDELLGCVTADSDGQHSIKDIKACIAALEEEPNKLIMGCRDFNLPDVPNKSKFGNKLTRKICKWLCGVDVTDTQTGLRAIPAEFMRYLLNTSGERFEFETNMLIETRNRIEIKEIPIETIYDSKTDHKTHFDPIKDSLRIYKIFGGKFLKFMVSSLSSSVVDLVLFALMCSVLKDAIPLWYVAIATVVARVISATYNYLINYKLVFKSNEKHSVSMVKYFALAVVQMSLSALLVTLLVSLLSFIPEVAIKIVVDVILFFISYRIQNQLIFK